jgi:hypothetical protein
MSHPERRPFEHEDDAKFRYKERLDTSTKQELREQDVAFQEFIRRSQRAKALTSKVHRRMYAETLQYAQAQIRRAEASGDQKTANSWRQVERRMMQILEP